MPAGSAGSASASARPVPWIACRWRWQMCSSATSRDKRPSSSPWLEGACRFPAAASRVALAGADSLLKIDGRPVTPLTSVTVHDGQTIELATARSGIFFYLAVAGGFAVAPALGSLSLHHRTGIGGLEGRTLRAGDRLPLGAVRALRSRACPPGASTGPGRGPSAWCSGRRTTISRPPASPPWSNSEYAISDQADRMGMRLTGPHDRAQRQGLQHRIRRHSHGWHAGARQRAAPDPAGRPANHRRLSQDRHRHQLGPAAPGAIAVRAPRLRFAAVERAEAVRIARAADAEFRALVAKMRPAGLAGLDSSELLAVNLVDGVVDARW